MSSQEEIYKYIGNKIRIYRTNFRMTQEQLAEKIGTSANTISRWETATYKLDVAELEKLSRELGEPIWAFLPSSVKPPVEKLQALLSATGDLPEEDIEELQRYADFIRAKKALQKQKRRRTR